MRNGLERLNWQYLVVLVDTDGLGRRGQLENQLTSTLETITTGPPRLHRDNG